MPNLSRLKSIRRYIFLCAPPLYRAVTWPMLLRPPVRFLGSRSDFSGVIRVISSNPETERKRVAAVMGRNCLMLISALEHGDRVAFLEGYDRLLPSGRGAAGPPPHHLVPAHLHRADGRDGYAEELLERRADLVLVGLGVHLEGVDLRRLIRGRALLGHDRPYDRLVQGRHLVPLLLLGGRLLRRTLGRRLLGGL